MRKNTSAPSLSSFPEFEIITLADGRLCWQFQFQGIIPKFIPRLVTAAMETQGLGPRCPAAEAITMGISGDTRIKSVEPIRSIVEQCPLLGI